MNTTELTDTTKLQIDNYPKVMNKATGVVIVVNCLVDEAQEISISINNCEIIDKSQVISVINNEIELSSEVLIEQDDRLVVVYCSI
jgi:hypothetical protein